MRILRIPSIANLALLFAVIVGSAFAQSQARTFELRIYTANAGKMTDFQAAFRTQALPLLAKNGIENLFDGTVLEGARSDGTDAANMLVCIVAHKDRAAAEKTWAAFDAPTGSLLAKPAYSIFATTTEFSPVLEAPTTGATNRVFELRKYNTGEAGLPRMVEEFKSGLAAILTKQGMTPIFYSTADDHSSFIYLLAHKDREAARASWGTFMADFRPFTAEFNARVPAPPNTGPRTPDDNRFLAPADYSPLR